MDLVFCCWKRSIHVSRCYWLSLHSNTEGYRCTACELTWSHWTKPIEPTPDKPHTTFELRPWWQRLPAVTAQGAVGGYLAFMIIVARTRIVRKLWIIPPSTMGTTTTEKRVFLQCLHHFKTQGQMYPYNRCKLQNSEEARKHEKEMFLKVDGVRGYYSLYLEGATINGEKATRKASMNPGLDFEWARREMVQAWGGTGEKRRYQPRFVSGPAAGRS